MNKRDFLKTLSLAGLALPFSTSGMAGMLHKYRDHSPGQLAAEDDFWAGIRSKYLLKPDYINLENGYYSMMPQQTLETYISMVKEINTHASWYMRKNLSDDKIAVRQQMADFSGCAVNEIIITRNTTESMDTVICGMDWKQGDEAIMAEQDYGAMLDMFQQQSKRYGMVNIMLSIPNHPQSDEEIVSLYEKAITPKTRLIMVCHMINITGQILPVRKICDMAKGYGVKVLVDGAHALAHFDFRISELNCDYYASSLHKWLGVPLGAGLLYVRQENIAGLWPLFADSTIPDDDIRKLNHTGTHPMHTELTISQAIQFHQQIGSKRKEERLRYLQNYWTSKVRGVNGITVNTPADATRCCGIGNAGLSNIKPAELASTLLEKYKIWTVAIDRANVQGCRITPNVFTTTEELDVLVTALMELKQ